LSRFDPPDVPAERRAIDVRHIARFGTILFAVSLILGVAEGFLTPHPVDGADSLLHALVGYLVNLVAVALISRRMTVRQVHRPFLHASLALLAAQAFGLCLTLSLMAAWPRWFGSPDFAMTAIELAILFSGLMLGVAWGIYAMRHGDDTWLRR
jgi:uncharacterized membrane protein